MSTKYFRFMKNPDADWDPIWTNPELYVDDELAAYPCAKPKEGDYILLHPNGDMLLQRPTDFDAFVDVEFRAMPPLESLLSSGVVIETSHSIMVLDYSLQTDLFLTFDEILHMEYEMEALEKLKSEKWLWFPTKAACRAKRKYQELKTNQELLYERYENLMVSLREDVVKPLIRQKEQE